MIAIPEPRRKKSTASALPIAGDTALAYPHISLRPSTTGGVGFGDAINDIDRQYATEREPVAYRMTYLVAHDIFSDWFTVDDSNTDHPDPELDARVQAVLSEANAKREFTTACMWERTYGKAILVIAYDDASSAEDLAKPVRRGASVVGMAAYPKTKIEREELDTDINSLSYGSTLAYWLSRGSNIKTKVHASRVVLLSVRPGGVSVLDPVWDDLTNLRNIRWGMGQTMYRYGSGFPDITVKGATKKQLDDYAEAETIKNIMSRTYMIHSDLVEVEFKGAQGVALNPDPYYQAIMENISAGSGIPLAILRGAQAGALTGSEVNEREYAHYIAGQQALYEPALRQVIGAILASGEAEARDYRIAWGSTIQESEQERAAIDLQKEQALRAKMNYMTINEVRELVGLEPVPEGETIISNKPQPASPFADPGSASAPSNPSSDSKEPELRSALEGITRRCKSSKITREQALHEGRAVIKTFLDMNRRKALAYLNAKTGRSLGLIPAEQEDAFKRLEQSYVASFTKILDDALKRQW